MTKRKSKKTVLQLLSTMNLLSLSCLSYVKHRDSSKLTKLTNNRTQVHNTPRHHANYDTVNSVHFVTQTLFFASKDFVFCSKHFLLQKRKKK